MSRSVHAAATCGLVMGCNVQCRLMARCSFASNLESSDDQQPLQGLGVVCSEASGLCLATCELTAVDIGHVASPLDPQPASVWILHSHTHGDGESDAESERQHMAILAQAQASSPPTHFVSPVTLSGCWARL